jgi:hypothetical protein
MSPTAPQSSPTDPGATHESQALAAGTPAVPLTGNAKVSAGGSDGKPTEEGGTAPLLLGFGVILVVVVGVRLLAARRRLAATKPPAGLAAKAIELRARYATQSSPAAGAPASTPSGPTAPAAAPAARSSPLTSRVESLERALRRAEARIGELEHRLGSAPSMLEAKQPVPLVPAVRSQILALAGEGVSEVQISQKLGIPAAEIRLVLAMRRAG